MGLFDWMYEDPSEAAQGYLDKIPSTIKPYYEPYVESGRNAMSDFQKETGRLLNPNQLISEIGGGYQQSPGFKFALQQALQGAGHAAAAGGMAGSPQHEQENMGIATNLGNQDYYNYMSNALGLYGMGYKGMGDMMHQGYKASSDLASDLGSALGSQAQLGYAGASNRNMMNFGTLAQLLQFMKPGNNPLAAFAGGGGG